MYRGPPVVFRTRRVVGSVHTTAIVVRSSCPIQIFFFVGCYLRTHTSLKVLTSLHAAVYTGPSKGFGGFSSRQSVYVSSLTALQYSRFTQGLSNLHKFLPLHLAARGSACTFRSDAQTPPPPHTHRAWTSCSSRRVGFFFQRIPAYLRIHDTRTRIRVHLGIYLHVSFFDVTLTLLLWNGRHDSIIDSA